MSPGNHNLQDRWSALQSRILDACHKAGRNREDVLLLAASKQQPVDAVREVAGLGQRAFGENYVDQAVEKIRAVADLDLEWHFIGPIQSNKTRAIAQHFDWVQSIDRPKIIRRLAEQRAESLGPLNVLIQVNLDDEPQKAGCPPDQITELANLIASKSTLRLRGLMAIPAPREDYDGQLAVLEKLRRLHERLAEGYPVDTLSAGMTGDLEAAIAAGSTMVRVGTALFGART
jgi:PLP dependent protein